jgi:hypothetical protein
VAVVEVKRRADLETVGSDQHESLRRAGAAVAA